MGNSAREERIEHSEHLAHTDSGGRVDTVRDHLQAVADRAAEYAAAFGAADEARLAGLLHDLGKYGDLFQKRLRGESKHIDHWSAGAWRALSFRAKGMAAALAIQGHHVGLQHAARDALLALNSANWDPRQHEGRSLSHPPDEAIAEIDLPAEDDLPPSLYDRNAPAAAAMLDVRMLFSALVDADFVETEAHFNARDGQRAYRDPGPMLDPGRALDVLKQHLVGLASESQAAVHVRELRQDLLSACLAAAEQPQGLFTLTAPTGSGKTLSMLALALKHAAIHGLRRVVLVIPYLSIIEQTVSEYKKLFDVTMGRDYVLEHHSLAGTHGADDGNEGVRDAQRLRSENWDAPVIVTTSVQMLESLFANRPSACRKLHRLAKSVVLFDEVQTLPTRLVIPTLATLSRLVERYQSTVVFATATQPAFRHLHEKVKEFCACGWQPTEIARPELTLFDRARRTSVDWPTTDARTSWDELSARLADESRAQVLCVVNLKKHALMLFAKLSQRCTEGLFHLSTNMCPAHRKAVLDEVRLRLETDKPCRLISTQCVEAGVDVDFPVVYRAWGPLDSIAQAAGRCNRNGRLEKGTVCVFLPEDEGYPDGTYQRAAGIARLIDRNLDIDDPAMFQEYYRQLYDLERPENLKPELTDAIKRSDFVATAEHYRVIASDAINVLVPYDADTFRELAEAARRDGLTRKWILSARPYAVSLFRPRHGDPIADRIVPLPTGRGEMSDDWFEYVGDVKDYHPATGLVASESLMRILIG